MIATHFGTPNAADKRVREAFIEHVCLVNDELLTEKEDLLDEKAALAAENDALAAENTSLRHEIRQYALVEKKQALLRGKQKQETDALAACLDEIKQRPAAQGGSL